MARSFHRNVTLSSVSPAMRKSPMGGVLNYPGYGPNGAGHQSLGQATQGAQPQVWQQNFRSPERAGHLACHRKGCPALTGLAPSACQFQGRCPWLCCLAPSGPILLSNTAQGWPSPLAVSRSILSKPVHYHHGGQFPVILRPDLRKDLPFPVLHEIHEKEPSRGRRLTDRLWLPVFDCLHMKNVVAQVLFGKSCGIGDWKCS